MGLKERLARAKEQKLEEASPEAGLLERIVHRIKMDQVVPIISNSFRIEQIFRDEKNATGPASDPSQMDEESLTIEEQLTNEWANEIGYPLPDLYNLARVAQYRSVELNDDQRAREEYLEFLKKTFLGFAGVDEESSNLANNLLSQVGGKSLPDLVRELEYPRFPAGTEDPLLLLARLPLSMYMTTSHYDFLERALIDAGKTPITQACFWSGLQVTALSQYLDNTNTNYVPTSTSPIVYHFFGLEDYPNTLVLSEDDYMNFLIAMARDDETDHPTLPLTVRQTLAQKTLLLLGYQLRDWDFRVLFRFIAKYRNVNSKSTPPRGMIIQLKPNKKQLGNSEKSIQYLGRYFDKKHFDVEMSEAENFIQQLYAKVPTGNRGN